MNRLVRGSVLIATAVGAWACGGDPFAENLDEITEVSATPAAVFVINTDSQTVVVEALNKLGQQVSTEFTLSNVTAGLVVNRDTGFAPVIEGPNLDTRARFFVKGADPNTFVSGSFVITAGDASTTVDVSVVPSTNAGTIPIVFSNPTPALGDTVTLTLPANARITETSTITFADPTLSAVIAGASPDSNTLFVLLGPGITDQLAIVNDVAFSYLPGQTFDLQTAAVVTTPAIASVAVNFSTLTPAGGAQITATAPAGFTWLPDGDSTARGLAIAFVGIGNSFIDSVSADSSTVYFVPPPGATGSPVISGIALDFLLGVPLTDVPATTSLTVGPSPFTGTDNPATAPVLTLPASGGTLTIHDGGPFGGGVFAANDSRFYVFTVAAPVTIDMALEWSSTDDLGLFILDNPITAIIAAADDNGGTGGARGTGQPEVATDITLQPGSYVLSVTTFGSAPAVYEITIHTD